MNPNLFYQWTEQVEQHFQALDRWQARGLALLSFGLVLSRHASLSRIAEELTWMGQIESLTKRFKGWIANPRLDGVLSPVSCGSVGSGSSTMRHDPSGWWMRPNG